MLAAWVDRACAAAGVARRGDVAIRVVDAAAMQRLNQNFRDQDKTTNVLAFPAGDIAGLPQDAAPLGDIVACASVIAGEAEAQKKSVADHWSHMIVHGTLHLLGYDHINADDALRMERLEIDILAAHGVANPYSELAGGN